MQIRVMAGLCHLSVWIFVGVFIAALLLIPKVLNARYLSASPGGFALRRPWEQRAFLGLMGLMCLVVPLMVADSNLRTREGVQTGFWPAGAVLTGICLVGAAFFGWASYPQELAVDEKRRTYSRSEGWQPFRRVFEGSLSDLEGVWTEYGYRNYAVYVGWRTGPRRLLVEQFRSEDGADLYANELADVLGVRRLEVDRFSRLMK